MSCSVAEVTVEHAHAAVGGPRTVVEYRAVDCFRVAPPKGGHTNLKSGSPGWTRTSDILINSSFRGANPSITSAPAACRSWQIAARHATQAQPDLGSHGGEKVGPLEEVSSCWRTDDHRGMAAATLPGGTWAATPGLGHSRRFLRAQAERQ